MPPRARPDVFEALHDLMHAYRARMVRAMTSVHPDLTFNEVRALNFIGRHPIEPYRIGEDESYSTVPGFDPAFGFVYDQDTDDITDVGCWNEINVRTLNFGPNTDEREALRIDGEWGLQLRAPQDRAGEAVAA